MFADAAFVGFGALRAKYKLKTGSLMILVGVSVVCVGSASGERF